MKGGHPKPIPPLYILSFTKGMMSFHLKALIGLVRLILVHGKLRYKWTSRKWRRNRTSHPLYRRTPLFGELSKSHCEKKETEIPNNSHLMSPALWKLLSIFPHDFGDTNVGRKQVSCQIRNWGHSSDGWRLEGIKFYSKNEPAAIKDSNGIIKYGHECTDAPMSHVLHFSVKPMSRGDDMSAFDNTVRNCINYERNNKTHFQKTNRLQQKEKWFWTFHIYFKTIFF